jgi:hypothetical protein
MNLSINEKRTIEPAGRLVGSKDQQMWQILNWHEVRLKKLTDKILDLEKHNKALAEEVVTLKANSKN